MRTWTARLTAIVVACLSIFPSAPQSQAATYVTSGLVLRLDASIAGSYSGTTWSDQSGSGYNATAYGSPTLNSADGSISFNGTNQYFDLGTTPFQYTNASNFSFQVVFTPTVASATITSLIARQNTSRAGNWILGISNSKAFYYVESSPWGINSSSTLSAGTKYVMTFVHDSSGYITPYLNGVQDGTKTYFGTVSAPSIKTMIGAYLNVDTPDYFFNGKIYSIFGYNKALTAAEVAQNYSAVTRLGPATISLAINGNPSSVVYRSNAQIRLTSNQPGKVIFFQNGKRISGCINIALVDTATTANCSWRPTIHGTTQLSATITPTNAFYDPTTTYIKISADARTTKR